MARHARKTKPAQGPELRLERPAKAPAEPGLYLGVARSAKGFAWRERLALGDLKTAPATSQAGLCLWPNAPKARQGSARSQGQHRAMAGAMPVIQPGASSAKE